MFGHSLQLQMKFGVSSMKLFGVYWVGPNFLHFGIHFFASWIADILYYYFAFYLSMVSGGDESIQCDLILDLRSISRIPMRICCWLCISSQSFISWLLMYATSQEMTPIQGTERGGTRKKEDGQKNCIATGIFSKKCNY